MKILIAYAGKNGTTADCVRRLEEHLGDHEVTVADLSVMSPDPTVYDVCVVGASVRFGRLQKAARVFLKKEREALMSRRLALFFVCGLAHEIEYYQDVLFDRELRRAAFALIYFGGSLRTDGLPFWDRMLVKSLRSAIVESDIEDGEFTPAMPGILPENIEKLAGEIKRIASF